MLELADAAIVIGDPALMAFEERRNRFERTGEELVYHDLAEDWWSATGLPFVSAVWCLAGSTAAPGATGSSRLLDEHLSEDFVRSRDHGLANIDALAGEWARKIPLTEQSIRSYLTTNIHYVLDEECVEGMRGFFRMASEAKVLPYFGFEYGTTAFSSR
jgi:chorismate dehydratase